MSRFLTSSPGFFALALLLALAARPMPARAAGVITNCTPAALEAALRGGGTVLLTCDSQITITITNTITISADTVLEAANRAAAISGVGGTNGTRLFLVQPGVRFTLKNLNVLNGRVNGRAGARDEAGERAGGAAIYNQGGVVTLLDVTFSGHVVNGGAGGTGLDNLGGGSSGQDGRPGGAALGAAIYNDAGILFASNAVFQANTATAGGGGAGGTGGTGGHGGFGGDGGAGGAGGGAAVYNSAGASATFMDCTFATNRVAGATGGLGGAGGGGLGFPGEPGQAGAGLGGAVFNDGGTMEISHCTFSQNTAAGAAGINGGTGVGFETAGLDGAPGGAAFGGGMFSQGGITTLTNVTFFQNALTGGAGGQGGGGSAGGFGGDGGDGGQGGAALGGGAGFGGTGTARLVNCTLAEHTLTGGAGGAGGSGGSRVARAGRAGSSGQAACGTIHSGGAAVAVQNSILASSTGGAELNGTVTDAGFNLVSDSSLALQAGLGSRTNTPAKLGGFANNGGLTSTLALATNSPAINGITSRGGNGCPPTDQRHALRNDPCDIGAFEFGGAVPTAVLGVRRQVTEGAILVTWPVSATAFQLESTTALPGGWAALTNVVVTAGGTNSSSIVTTNQQRFFRLRK